MKTNITFTNKLLETFVEEIQCLVFEVEELPSKEISNFGHLCQVWHPFSRLSGDSQLLQM